MHKHLRVVLLALAAMPLGMAIAGELEAFKFSGSGNGRTPVFEVTTPWLVDWRAQSEFPRATFIEFRLHDARTGNILGIINQAEGGARGLKLMDEVGTFRIEVSAGEVDWSIDVIQVSAERAAELKDKAGRQPSLAERSKSAARRLPEGPFAGWHAPDDSTIFLDQDDGIGWRLSFAPPCAGVSQARGITFMTSVDGPVDEYDSVMLDDGSRCYFDSVAPTSWVD